MPKNLTKTWLRDLQHLMRSVPTHYTREMPYFMEDEHAAGVKVPTPALEKGQWIRSYHAAPPLPGRFINHLTYGLYVPSLEQAPVLRPMPLVVMLHGCKQTIEAFAQGTRMNLVADAQGFAVVYPEQSKHMHAHRCWHWYDDRETAGRGEARTIMSLIDALIDEHGFDAERVYVAGLSAGAGLASLLALHYPQRFAAVGLHSAPVLAAAHSVFTAIEVMQRGAREDPIMLIEAAVPVRAAYPGMPAIIVQGEDDHVVNPKNAEHLTQEFLWLNGFIDSTGAWRAGALDKSESQQGDAFFQDYRMDGRCVVRLCRVAGLGHAWAGGDETFPFHSAHGPCGSALFWEFFRAHHRKKPESDV